MKTSIRLALTSLLVCAITFAASGAPLPFLPKAQPTIATLDAPLPPASADAGPGAGLEIAAQNLAAQNLAAMSFSPN